MKTAVSSFFSSLKKSTDPLRASFWKFWNGLDIRLRNGILLVFAIIGLISQRIMGPSPHPLIAIIFIWPFVFIMYLNSRLMKNNWWWLWFAAMVVFSAIKNPTGFYLLTSWSSVDLMGILFWLPGLFYAKRLFSGK